MRCARVGACMVVWGEQGRGGGTCLISRIVVVVIIRGRYKGEESEPCGQLTVVHGSLHSLLQRITRPWCRSGSR
jgi:hypothetical protein